jgi:hypothetical protein
LCAAKSWGLTIEMATPDFSRGDAETQRECVRLLWTGVAFARADALHCARRASLRVAAKRSNGWGQSRVGGDMRGKPRR